MKNADVLAMTRDLNDVMTGAPVTARHLQSIKWYMRLKEDEGDGADGGDGRIINALIRELEDAHGKQGNLTAEANRAQKEEKPKKPAPTRRAPGKKPAPEPDPEPEEEEEVEEPEPALDPVEPEPEETEMAAAPTGEW